MPTLSAPTVRYLFATSWAPRTGASASVRVPGGSGVGLDVGANLLNLAFWSLREQGLIALEQLRPVMKVSASVAGGPSFARATAVPGVAGAPTGLEGAVLAAVRGAAEPEGPMARLARRVAGDDPAGVRGEVLSLDLHSASPWSTVTGICCNEARDAGILEMKGWLISKPVIVDARAVAALRERDAEIVAGRTAYRARHADVDAAVIGDCFAALMWAHNTPG